MWLKRFDRAVEFLKLCYAGNKQASVAIVQNEVVGHVVSLTLKDVVLGCICIQKYTTSD